MDHDLYMFTSLEHNMLRQMTKKKTWRVYGEKTNEKTGITRRYYRCTECRQARACIMHADGTHVETKCIAPHAPSCQNHHHP